MGEARDCPPVADERGIATPESWARRLQRGEASAVQHVRERIRRILAHRSLSVAAAERDDLEQEVMMEVWQAVNRSRFDFAAGFWGFVEVVTARRTIDRLRSHRQKEPFPAELIDPEKGPLRQAQDRERKELALVTLSALDPQCREIITLRFRDEMSYREIARNVGKTEGALRVQLFRCIERARGLVETIVAKQDEDAAGTGS